MTDGWGHGTPLTLPFECIRSLEQGVAEVRVWRDTVLQCERVGKRIDLRGMGCADVINEPATLHRINHPNVVPIMTAAQVSDGFPPNMDVVEIVTPYYRRGSITDALLRGETFTLQQAVTITQHTLRGLGALHEQYGLCHRDMKSGNVLLPDVGESAMVADLGLAARFDDSGTVGAADNPTLYSPPEVGTGERLTRAADLWPVGLILRELVGGNFPYEDYSRAAIADRLHNGRSVLRKKDMDLPVWVTPSIARIYRKATQQRPERRYQTAAEMDDALAQATVVNWAELDEGPAWAAPFTHHPGRAVRVEAVPRRGGKFRLAILVDRGAGPRRVSGLPDVDVADLSGAQARRVFDHASRIASAR